MKMKNGIFTIENELRPCYIVDPDGRKSKGLFHGWSFNSNVVAPPSGIVTSTTGIVEVEDGSVICVNPGRIQFSNSKFNEYCWVEKGE